MIEFYIPVFAHRPLTLRTLPFQGIVLCQPRRWSGYEMTPAGFVSSVKVARHKLPIKHNQN